jgi:hypothetical protein
VSDVLKRLGPIISNAKLQDIRLVESSCKAFAHDLSEAAEVDVRINSSAKAILRAAGLFSVLADLEVMLLPAGSSPPDGARVAARFEVRYQIPQNLQIHEGLLDEFARVNGVFNAWPYWREFVQNTLVRMGLPPLTLPLYRVPTQPASTQGKTEAKR